MTTSRLETSNAGSVTGPATPSEHDTQNLVEQILLEIWNTTLGRTDTKPTDPFFEIGGDSLLALVTIEQINQRLGWKLDLGDLLRHPSVRALAAHKALPQVASTERAIVRMRSDGSRTPIVFIHSVTGLVFAYGKLAHHLGDDRGCYGIQSPMFMDAGVPGSAPDSVPGSVPDSVPGSVPDSVEGLAELYADLLADELGEGDFHVVSWSAGGTIALELARCASARGLGLKKLVLVDSYLWNVLPAGNASPLATTDEAALQEFRADVLAQVPNARHAPQERRAQHARTPPAAGDRAAVFQELAAAMFGTGAQGANDAGTRFVERLYAAYRATCRAVAAYHPTPVPAEALLLIGAENDTLEAWRSVMRGGLTVERLDGDHFGLLREPEASKIAARIEAYCP